MDLRSLCLTAMFLCGAGCAPSLDFSLPDVDGNRVTPLSGEATVVAFWATWCGPCRRELAEMNGMYQRLHPRGLELYAISVDSPDTIDDVEAWVSEQRYAFPVLLDSGHGLFLRTNPRGSVPYLLIFNASGELVERREGYTPDGVADLEATLDRMLPPNAPQAAPTP